MALGHDLLRWQVVAEGHQQQGAFTSQTGSIFYASVAHTVPAQVALHRGASMDSGALAGYNLARMNKERMAAKEQLIAGPELLS